MTTMLEVDRADREEDGERFRRLYVQAMDDFKALRAEHDTLTAHAALHTAALARERAEVLDEVSYRWDRRNEAGKPFSDWLWEWVEEARDKARSLTTQATKGPETGGTT